MAESDGLENRCAFVAPWVRIPLPPPRQQPSASAARCRSREAHGGRKMLKRCDISSEIDA